MRPVHLVRVEAGPPPGVQEALAGLFGVEQGLLLYPPVPPFPCEARLAHACHIPLRTPPSVFCSRAILATVSSVLSSPESAREH
eukprot:7719747-Pyramimonas_sp.AAC.1